MLGFLQFFGYSTQLMLVNLRRGVCKANDKYTSAYHSRTHVHGHNK